MSRSGANSNRIEDTAWGRHHSTQKLMTSADVTDRFVFGVSEYETHLDGSDPPWDGGYTTADE